MIPEFKFCILAARNAASYLSGSSMKSHYYATIGKESSSILDSQYSISKSYQRIMEQEISQHIFGSNRDMLLALRNDLQDILSWWQFEDAYEKYLPIILHNENLEIEVEYKAQIEIEEAKFRQSVDYSKPNGLEYEVEINWPFAFGVSILHHRKRKVVNNWYYENDKPIPYIDQDYLNQYLELLNDIIGGFKKIATTGLERLIDKIKYMPIPPEANIVQIAATHKMKELSAPTINSPKIKIGLSIPQLAALFLALREKGLITETDNPELSRQIAATFCTKGTDNLKAKKVSEQLNDIDTAALDYWLVEITQYKSIFYNLKFPK